MKVPIIRPEDWWYRQERKKNNLKKKKNHIPPILPISTCASVGVLVCGWGFARGRAALCIVSRWNFYGFAFKIGYPL